LRQSHVIGISEKWKMKVAPLQLNLMGVNYS